MPLSRRVSEEVMERYAADRELAGGYQHTVAAAGEAEGALREAQAGDRSAAEIHELSTALDQALTRALLVAEAAERVAMGPRSYGPPAVSDDATEGGDRAAAKAARAADIARRKARARSAVRPWTDEVDRLRTAREAHRLGFRADRRALATPDRPRPA